MVRGQVDTVKPNAIPQTDRRPTAPSALVSTKSIQRAGIAVLLHDRLGDDPQANDGVHHHQRQHGILAVLGRGPVAESPDRNPVGQINGQHVA